MATYEQVIRALRKADAAGDTEAAKALARKALDLKAAPAEDLAPAISTKPRARPVERGADETLTPLPSVDLSP